MNTPYHAFSFVRQDMLSLQTVRQLGALQSVHGYPKVDRYYKFVTSRTQMKGKHFQTVIQTLSDSRT